MKTLLQIACVCAVLTAIGMRVWDVASPSEDKTSYATAVEELALDTASPSTEDQYETVLGIEVRKDRNCTVVAHEVYEPNGDMSYAHECIPDQAPPQHRYADLELNELHSLAYADSEAAEILAIKLIEIGDEEGGLQYVYRAVALESGENFRAFSRVRNSFYSGIADVENPTGELQPRFDHMTKAYVFERVKSLLVGKDHTVYLRGEMEQWGYNDFATLDAEAARVVANMAQIERDVVGLNTIGEKIDA